MTAQPFSFYRRFRFVIACSLSLCFLCVSLAFATWASGAVLGTTGKIVGTVIDANTKEPLIGARVVVEGTTLGANTDINGNYVILNVPPGVYKVRASYVGYQTKVVTNVRVKADYTERVDFALALEDVRTEEIVVKAERPLVIKDQTYSAAVVGAEEIQALPVEDINQVIGIQAGVVGGSFRGGRRNEVAYLVDGISVTDSSTATLGAPLRQVRRTSLIRKPFKKCRSSLVHSMQNMDKPCLALSISSPKMGASGILDNS